MQKDFDRWNEIKKQTQDELPRFYTVREIWWCRIGVNIGTEQDGGESLFLRPVVIIRSFGAGACVVIPLTTSQHKHPLRIPIGEIQGKNASANISQIRVVDTRRLIEKVGFLDEKIFTELRKAVKGLF
jgi:mRNA interferase MazF